MTLMNQLALSHLKQNKKQAASGLIAIILAVGMMVGISTFFFSMYDASTKFAAAHGLSDTMSNSTSGLVTLGGLLGAVIAGAAVVVISNAFNIQASERIKQFGMLKSVGATEAQIKATITAESNWLSLIGIPAGIVLGHLFCFGGMALMGQYADDSMQLSVQFSPLAILIASALGYATIRLASLLTARKVAKLSAIEAIRQTDDIKIDSKNLKTSALINKLFGFEGTLAAKSLKRNRRKFRVTVLSLVTSIILFLGAFSYGDTLIKTAQGAFANTGANVVIHAYIDKDGFSKLDDYEKLIKAQKPKKLDTIYNYRYVPNEGTTNEGQGQWFNVITMNDKDYADYCQKAKIKQGELAVLDNGNHEKLPFEVSMPERNISFKVTQKSTLTNPYLKSITYGREPNLIIPRDEVAKYKLPVVASYYISADKAIDFIEKMTDKAGKVGLKEVNLNNIEEYTRELQRMYAIMMTFVYCFIGMLALIGATSVLATINSNINLRRNEFATLQAVGLQSKQLHKMLNIESLLYGSKALIIGTPIGIALSYWMYQVAISGNDRLTAEKAASFYYQPPYFGILACILGVYIINFAAMYYATSKIRKSNIAESMRSLN